MVKQRWELFPYCIELFVGTVYNGFIAFVPLSCPAHNALSQPLKNWNQFVFSKLTKVVMDMQQKVERSHRTDKGELYQLLSYKDDVDLEKKLEAWENFYNYHRPHSAFDGITPYEQLKSLLKY